MSTLPSSLTLPLTLPLRGSRLIEASAGTGKTWTIAALVVRLVLGHGRSAEQAPLRPFLPSEILVMTFTRAATRELADRIRNRLAEAARCFAAEEGSAQDSGDDFLRALRADYPIGTTRREAAWRLAAAAEAMDDAAIHTIDAWCHRMLREHAFDSGQFGDEQLDSDESGLIAQAVRDWWRCEVYPCSDAQLALLGRVWADVSACEQDLSGLLPLVPLLDPAAAEPSLPDRLDAYLGSLHALCEGQSGWVVALRQWLEARFAVAADNPFNANRLRLDTIRKRLEGLSLWMDDPLAEDPPLPKDLELLTPDGLRDRLKKGRSVDLPPQSEALAQWLERLKALPDIEVSLRIAAAHQVASRLEGLKRRAGRIGFADLLARLDVALRGPQGATLRQRIVAQAPVVLIDEFQDTSLTQMRLFERLYPPESLDAEGLTLLLIGDPKQSIYAFRGADIHSYLRARAATAPRHHALGTNHRSEAALVGAVNTLFERAEREAPGGAFAWRGADGAAIPFEPVAAQGRSSRWVAGPGRQPAPVLTVGVSEEVHDANTARRLAARWAARVLVARLAEPDAGFADPVEDRFQRLAPRDIAVLVHSRREAELMRTELLRQGVRSVYLSDQDSVMDSAEAADLLLWLRTLAHPADPELARAAWAGGTFGEPLPRLAAWLRDDERWDDCLNLLRRLGGVWQRQGVLAMLRLTLHERGLPARWLAEPGGERRLTNVLHLGELLQLASRELDGVPALLRWFEMQIQATQEGTTAEEQIVRLESEADLVRIVTIHKSKGLEYPLVFLPFAGIERSVRSDSRRPLVLADETLPEAGRRVCFAPDEADRQQAEGERQREQLRLLYVALTRPRHALWIGVVSKGKFATTALAHLLQRADMPAPPDEAGLGERFEALWADSIAAGEVAVERIDAESVFKAPMLLWSPENSAPALQPVPAYPGRFERDWSIGSFSAWVRDLPREVHQPPLDPLRIEALREEWQQGSPDDDEGSEARLALRRSGSTALRHRFPHGPRAGRFLHELLQDLAERGFGQIRQPSMVARLQRRLAAEALPGAETLAAALAVGEESGSAALALALQGWLTEVAEAPLPGGGTLAGVSQRLAEMEFWMPAQRVPTTEVDALCCTAWWPEVARPALAERWQQGLMMGFADLVFEQGGRYWVLDYKSNRLGDDDAAYTDEALRQAVLAHRYDVQAALYLLALHRLLRQRFGAAYEPEHQLGGALLMFLRGLQGPAGGLVTLPADPRWLDQLDATLGEGEAEA